MSLLGAFFCSRMAVETSFFGSILFIKYKNILNLIQNLILFDSIYFWSINILTYFSKHIELENHILLI